MGVFFAFIVGWAMGSRGGEQHFDDVVDAFNEVRDSDEMATLLGALRVHSAHILRQAAEWLEDAESKIPQTTDLLDRVRNLVQPREAEDDSEY